MARRGTTESLGQILASLMQKRAFARPLALEAWKAAWQRAAGERLSARTRVVGYRDGVLTVETASAAQRYELESFHGPALLARLQADTTVPTLRKLMFRTGNAAP